MIKVDDIYEIMSTMKYSLGDKLTEEVMQLNIDQWKIEIESKVDEQEFRKG